MREILTESQIYQGIYNTNLTEEVEIASEYFYSEGINEFGIDLLIEDLGIDEFAEFVYEIAEEYTLTEARTLLGKKKNPQKLPKGTAPSTSTKKAVAKHGTTRKIASGGFSSTIKQKAVKSAASKQQPTRAETPAQAKQGIGAKIGAALKYAGQRAKADTELLKKSWSTAREVGKGHEAKVAKAAGTVAGAVHGAAKVAHTAGQKFASTETGKQLKAGLEKTAKATAAAAGAGAGSLKAGKTPAAAAGRAAGTVVRKMKAEGYDTYDIVLEYIINEEFADTEEAAIAIMANMSEEWKKHIIEMSDFEAGGGNAKMAKTGMSKDKVIALGQKNLAAKSSSSTNSSSGSSNSGGGINPGDYNINVNFGPKKEPKQQPAAYTPPRSLTGKSYGPDTAKSIFQKPSYDTPSFADMKDDQMRSQAQDADEWLVKAGKQKPGYKGTQNIANKTIAKQRAYYGQK
jgi:hypothetical protein